MGTSNQKERDGNGFQGVNWFFVLLAVEGILAASWFFTTFASAIMAREVLQIPRQHPYVYLEVLCAFFIAPPVAWLFTLLLSLPIKRRNPGWGQAYQIMTIIHGVVLFGAFRICLQGG